MIDQARRWIRTLANDPLAVIGLALAVELGLFGLALLSPFPPPTFETSRSFAVMARMAPEWLWGALYLGLGIFCVFAVLSPWQRLGRSGCLVCGVAHGVLAILFGLGNPTGTGTQIYAVQMLLAYYVIWWAGRDA